MSATNTYSTQFVCTDPESKHPVRYTFQVKTPAQVLVDVKDLVAAGILVQKKPRRHEDIADFLKTMFPGKHTLTTTHFGVAMKLQREGTA